MLSPLKNRYFIAVLLLAVPTAVFAADIQIDGTCIQGTCNASYSGTADALQLGQSIALTNGNFPLVFGDGDTYSVSWSYSASYDPINGTELFVDPTVTYTGATPSVGNDVISFNFFQSYYNASPGDWDGTYSEDIPLNLSGNVGAGSTASGELFYDGQGLGLIGPFGPGSNSGSNSVALTGLDGDNLNAEFEFNYNFQAGTAPGAGGSSPAATPEPAETLPLGLALAGAACYYLTVRRRAH